jgi:hypothetical protein
MNSLVHKFKSSFAFLLIVLVSYSVFLLNFHHYERLTGDAALYLGIAEKYVSGDFGNAINGYWGPLLSWLLIPFLFLGSTHLFAINALNWIFGFLTIVGVWRLSYKFEMDDRIRSLILIPLLPILLFISLIQPMDFLLLCILIYYLNIIFRKDYPDRLFNALLCGVLGAFAYFSKPYGLPFFISHFLLINTCHYFRNSSKEHKKNVLRNVLAGFVLFSLLSGIWIALISNKYGHITFSNMGRGVFASLGPGSVHGTLEKGDPIIIDGFFEPPNETAFVIYEDPSYARKKTWSPLESRSSFKHFTSNFIENIFEGLRIYESYSRLSIAIVIAYILLIFVQPFNKLLTRSDLLYPLLTILLYTGGYMPFHFESRYLWIINILLLLMGGNVLTELFKYEFFKKNLLKNILAFIFIVSFVLTPIKSTIYIGKNDINKKMSTLGAELNKRYDIHGNIASNRQKMQVAIHDSWHNTYRLAYWLNSRYYGQARENISDEDLEKELKTYDIDYYFFWNESISPPRFMLQYKELTGGEIPGLKIYSLNEKK